jgi:hypothetical protein
VTLLERETAFVVAEEFDQECERENSAQGIYALIPDAGM